MSTKIDRCKTSSTEEVNGELFLLAGPESLSTSQNCDFISSWVPEASISILKEFLKEPVLVLAGAEKKAKSVFVIVRQGPDEAVFVVDDVIVFAGGGVLALLVEVGR